MQIESSLDCSNCDQESLCANRIFKFLFVQIEFSAYTKVIFSLCKKNFWMLCSRYLFVQIEFSKSGVFVHFVHFVLLCANRIYPTFCIFRTPHIIFMEQNSIQYDWKKQVKVIKHTWYHIFHTTIYNHAHLLCSGRAYSKFLHYSL